MTVLFMAHIKPGSWTLNCATNRTRLATTALLIGNWISQKLDRSGANTHYPPSRKITESAIFCCREVRRFDIIRIRRIKRIRSETIVETALPMRKDSVLLHLDLIVWSRYPLRGLQENIDTRMTALHKAMTTAPMMLATGLNFESKTLR